ncbi:FAD-binding protein [Chloroflexota bacterium]
MTTAPEELTGEGIVMAYEAGAELVDMEFPMFLPCCVYWPESMSGVDMPYVFSVTVGGWWLNKFGVRFIEKWDPSRMEQGTTRDIASIAMAMEMSKGRSSPHGGVWASFNHLPGGLLEEAIQSHEFWKNFTYGGFDLIEFDMDPRKVGHEVGPASHYWNGGIKVNGRSETNIPGLYAAGEVQGGTMGANRLGGNAVTECLVFGALSGASAANYANNAPPPEVDKEQVNTFYERLHAPLVRKDGADAYEMRKKMQKVAFNNIGPIRDGSGITTCIGEAEKMKKEMLPNLATKHKSKVYNREWMIAMENEALLQIMEIIARTSLMREESRGALYRRDCPDTDNKNWLKNIIVKNKDSKVSLDTKPIVASSLLTLPKAEKIPYMVPEWKFEKRSSENV